MSEETSASQTPNEAPASASKQTRPDVMKAANAVEKLAPFTAGHVGAKELLIDKWCSGDVTAYAMRQWEAKGNSLESLWKAGPPEGVPTRTLVRKSLIKRSSQLRVDAKQWDWRRGRFFLTQSPVRARRVVLLEEVGFVAEDVDRLIVSLVPKKGAGGRPTETEAWTSFWMEVVRMALDGELTKEVLKNRKNLPTTLHIRLGWGKESKFPTPPLAIHTLTRATGKIWDTFIEPAPPKS